MDVQKIAVQFRLNEWAELVRERASSGQSVVPRNHFVSVKH